MRYIRVFAGAAVSLLAVLGLSAPALASSTDVGLFISFWKAPIPIIGTTLTNSKLHNTSFQIKDGWTITDPNGVCSASAQATNTLEGTVQTLWTFTNGSSSDTKVTGRAEWLLAEGNEVSWVIEVDVTDCQGNNGSAQYSFAPWLYQQAYAVKSSGWTVRRCTCYSNGTVWESTKVGATVTLPSVQSERLISLVSDEGPSRGKVGVYVNGALKQVVTLTAPENVNRVIVWNSGYLSATSTYTFTFKVMSGRIDIDAFQTIPFNTSAG